MHAEKLLSGHTPSDDSSSEAMLPDAQHLQTEFQISAPEKQRLPVYHARRAHYKSRTGCLTCKKRRVKCDEQKPHCQRCQNRAIPCSYSSELRSSRHGMSMDGMPDCGGPNTILFSLSLENTIKRIEETLKLDSKWTPYTLRNRDSAHPTSTVAFQHFINCSTETIAHPGIRNVMKTDMIRVSFTSAHLMYTILGVGMLHLNRLSPSKERSYAETIYWQHAIQLYQNALSLAVRKESVDSLLSTCMLMGAMTVCPEHFEPTDSWVLTNRPEALNWLCLQSGLRCILSLAAPYIPDSIWAAAFKEIKKEEHQIYNQGMQQGREGFNADMADLCEIDDFTTESTNLYYSPLRILTTLLGLKKNCRNSAKCASFMGRLECDFLTLLRKRDPPALIILAHWMGLMCLLSQWQPWVEGRIRAECVAICMFLEHSTDPRILRLLRFPADSCGYELKNL